VTGARRLPLALALLAGLAGCRPQGPPEPGGTSGAVKGSAAREEARMDEQAKFDEALASTGQAYLDAERRLRDDGAAAEPVLRRNLTHPDPIGRLLARTLLAWLGASGAEYQAALDYLDSLPARIAHTPITTPSPLGAASYLTLHFEGRVADALALRLVKAADWPHWKAMAVLFYLKDHASPALTEPLLRFAADTADERWRAAAIDAARAGRDPALAAKIEAERLRLQAQKRLLPEALAALAREQP